MPTGTWLASQCGVTHPELRPAGVTERGPAAYGASVVSRLARRRCHHYQGIAPKFEDAAFYGVLLQPHALSAGVRAALLEEVPSERRELLANLCTLQK